MNYDDIEEITNFLYTQISADELEQILVNLYNKSPITREIFNRLMIDRLDKIRGRRKVVKHEY